MRIDLLSIVVYIFGIVCHVFSSKIRNGEAHTMKKALIALECFLLFVLCYYSLYMATDYLTPHGRFEMPIFVRLLDIIDLFIHEGGHGVFRLFGRFIYFLGGSLMQFILPTATIIVFVRTSGLRTLMLTPYWLGHNMINVSVYIDDASKTQLTLISRHALHDWRWLCTQMGNIDSAGDIASVVVVFGVLCFLGAIGMTIYFIIYDTRELFWPTPPPKPLPPGLHARTKAFLPPESQRPPENNHDSLL